MATTQRACGGRREGITAEFDGLKITRWELHLVRTAPRRGLLMRTWKSVDFPGRSFRPPGAMLPGSLAEGARYWSLVAPVRPMGARVPPVVSGVHSLPGVGHHRLERDADAPESRPVVPTRRRKAVIRSVPVAGVSRKAGSRGVFPPGRVKPVPECDRTTQFCRRGPRTDSGRFGGDPGGST